MMRFIISILMLLAAIGADAHAANGGEQVNTAAAATSKELEIRRASRAHRVFWPVFSATIEGIQTIPPDGGNESKELLSEVANWAVSKTQSYIGDLDGYAVAMKAITGEDAMDIQLVEAPADHPKTVGDVSLIYPGDTYTWWTGLAQQAGNTPPTGWEQLEKTLNEQREVYAMQF